jgi:GNAT superfamily N-acetyltransferase
LTPKAPIYQIRNALTIEFDSIGKLMVAVYSELQGFPNATEQPAYYHMLENIGDLTKEPNTELLVAVSAEGAIGGALVYFSDMKYYGSGGTATHETNASGFRLLAVDKKTRGQGLGKLLSLACIQKTKEDRNRTLIIHTTMAMQIAWKMYENLGFKRSEDLDFIQGELPVFGFRLLV